MSSTQNNYNALQSHELKATAAAMNPHTYQLFQKDRSTISFHSVSEKRACSHTTSTDNNNNKSTQIFIENTRFMIKQI